MPYSNKVIQAFAKDLTDKTQELIPGLPLVLQHEYGPNIWTWFTDNVKMLCEGYKYNPVKGLVEIVEAIETEDMDEDEEGEEDEEVKRYTINTETIPRTKLYDDGASIRSFKTPMQQTTGGNKQGNKETSTTRSTTSSLTSNPKISENDAIAMIQQSLQMLELIKRLLPNMEVSPPMAQNQAPPNKSGQRE